MSHASGCQARLDEVAGSSASRASSSARSSAIGGDLTAPGCDEKQDSAAAGKKKAPVVRLPIQEIQSLPRGGQSGPPGWPAQPKCRPRGRARGVSRRAEKPGSQEEHFAYERLRRPRFPRRDLSRGGARPRGWTAALVLRSAPRSSSAIAFRTCAACSKAVPRQRRWRQADGDRKPPPMDLQDPEEAGYH